MKSIRAVVSFACLAVAATVAADTSIIATPDAAPPVAVLSGLGAAPASSSPQGVVRSEAVAVASAALAEVDPGRALAFDLFDELSFLGTVTRRTDGSSGTVTLTGVLESVAGGDFVMVVNGDLVAASIRAVEHGTFRLRATGDGHVLEELDEAFLPSCGIDAIDAADAPPPPADGGVAGECDDGSQIDVLVVYTPAARLQAGGTGPIQNLISLAVANANAAYVNSGINTQLNLLLAAEVDYDESGNHLSLLGGTSDGVMDGVHILRDALGADIVSLYVDEAGYCGVAWLLPGLSTGYSYLGFNVNVWSCASLVFAHEVGHNQGCCHAPGDGGGCTSGGIFDYSVGYRFNGDSGTLWRTIMAYSPGTRIPHFSNPDVLYDGQPTGVEDGIDPGAENARTINETAFTVANYRCLSTVCDDLLDIPGDCNENEVADACEIAVGFSEDINGNDLPDECEPVPNDLCVAATYLPDGQSPVNNEVALTEGPGVPGCGTVLRDVWFKYFATESGYVTVTTYDLPFTSKIAAYAGCPDAGGQLLGLGASTDAVGNGTMGIAFSLGPCLADFDGSGQIDTGDLLSLLEAWGGSDPAHDIAPIGGDGIVNIVDLQALLASWGSCS
ncbi:MAG: M12 family metallo-peptidase [Planctomycetota bacterium]|jgi:hypothetical protein